MGIVEIVLIAIGLSMDAFAVSVGKGLSLRRVEPRYALSAGAWFGGFQALMPAIGYFLGRSFASVVVNVDHWIAFGLLLLIGLNMIRETIWGDEEDDASADFGLRTMFVMAVATSIDALAVGVSFAFLDVNVWLAVSVIGVITFALSASGIYLGRIFGSRLGDKAGIIGGFVLIAIGIKILIQHLVEGV